MYLNELLLRLLARDPYARCSTSMPVVRVLAAAWRRAAGREEAVEPALRAFELLLLRELGLLPALDRKP
jgi:recombinational DNA repair protein (RecF pathway)